MTTPTDAIIVLYMKTTIKIKLLPTKSQERSLRETMKRFNAACDFISEFAFENKCFKHFDIHKEIYYEIREKFKLSSQMTVRALAKVGDSYKAEKEHQHSFRPFSAVIYDNRILKYKGIECVSIWTVDGRLNVAMHLGGYQATRIDRRKGESDLILVDGVFYLVAVIDTPEEPPIDPKDFLGVDMGIVNIVVDSDGESFSGAAIERNRQRQLKLRGSLQKRGSRSAKRHLKRLGRKEARFRADINHCISKKLVKKAKDTVRGIAVEDLTHIRKQTTVRKSVRAKHTSWSFFQLRSFIEYKGLRDGIPVIAVNPRYTSQQCSQCGCTSKANRRSQSEFLCIQCGFSLNADYNAAINIASRASVNTPIVAPKGSYKPMALAVGC